MFTSAARGFLLAPRGILAALVASIASAAPTLYKQVALRRVFHCLLVSVLIPVFSTSSAGSALLGQFSYRVGTEPSGFPEYYGDWEFTLHVMAPGIWNSGPDFWDSEGICTIGDIVVTGGTGVVDITAAPAWGQFTKALTNGANDDFIFVIENPVTTELGGGGTDVHGRESVLFGLDPDFAGRQIDRLRLQVHKAWYEEYQLPANPTCSFSLEVYGTPSPKWYGVFIGSNDYKKDGTIKLNGQADAAKALEKFSHLIGFEGKVLLTYDVADRTQDPVTAIKAALSAYTLLIKPGDNLVLFYAGHGGGSESDPSFDESLYATETAGTGQFVDDDLTAWFLHPSRKDKWADVNKLFILDSCFSGGFWDGEDEDLVSLEKVALLAAADEMVRAQSDPEHGGEGFFSRALQEGLTKAGSWAKADAGQDGLTAEDLKAWLENYPLPVDAVGYIRQPWPDDLVPVEWDITFRASADFDMVIPEPATLSLLALGGLGLLACWRGGRQHDRPVLGLSA